MVMASKTGKKAANAAEKARRTHKPNAVQQKMAACHRKLLAKNDKKRKNREARLALMREQERYEEEAHSDAAIARYEAAQTVTQKVAA